MIIKSFRELDTYKEAFVFQQNIFSTSKPWPREEQYSLTDQIRRSSRSAGANIAEAWAKRRYPAHFLGKLTDSDGELQETGHWLDTALACEYIDQELHAQLSRELETLGRKLGGMIAKHESFCAQ